MEGGTSSKMLVWLEKIRNFEKCRVGDYMKLILNMRKVF